ncbi:MAG: cysteine desulfurase-like protein [Pseudomonas sp.]
MAFDVARVRGLHPTLGDGWVRLDAANGMLVPDSVATTVSTAFRTSMPVGPHPGGQRSRALLEAARQAVADLVGAHPAGVVLGADRAVQLMLLADAASSRLGLGNEVVVTRLDDEANIAPWLRAADRYGAMVRWAEVDIETGELPPWQWESLISSDGRLVALPTASAALGSTVDLRPAVKLAREAGALVVADHTAAAPYRLVDVNDLGVDVLALNALSWGGPPVSALVFRDPALIESFASMSLDPQAVGPARLELGAHQYGLLGGLVTSVEYLANLDESATGARRDRLVQLMGSAADYLGQLLEYLVTSLRSLPRVVLLGEPEDRLPVLSFAVSDVPAGQVVRRLVDNGILAVADAPSRALESYGVDDFGGAVTVGLAHYSTANEVDQLVRALASLG